MKRIAALLLALAMMMSLVACSNDRSNDPGQNSGTTTQYFTYATSSDTASMYPYFVAIGKTIEKAYPGEYSFTASTSRGASDCCERIRSGSAIFGMSVASTDYENYTGTGEYEGDPNSDARMLWYFGVAYYAFLVSEESGVNSFSDLNGKRINTGGTGSSLATITLGLLDRLGIECDIYEAAKSDAGDAYGNRQIVGLPTASAIPDSFILQMNASLSCKILSLTDDELEKVLDNCPYYVPLTIPAGSYDGQTEDVQTFGYMQGVQSSRTAVTQEDGYKFCVAMFGLCFDEWKDTWSQSTTLDYCQMMLDSPIPLHAGTVQYLVEKGYDVPAELIGPEYVPVS